VERKRMLTGKTIRGGDILIGLPSTGLHTNGYALARKLLFEVAGHRADTALKELDGSLAQELMKIHRSYLKPLRALHDAGVLKGAAHITGGGITDNTPRILPKGLGVRIDVGSWPVLPMFELLRKIGRIPEDDWRRTFNLGIGMILVISKRDLPKAVKMLKSLRERWYQIGEVVRGNGVVYK
jgi:phosphoribosylformylglycinamidine cyclo-ligase